MDGYRGRGGKWGKGVVRKKKKGVLIRLAWVGKVESEGRIPMWMTLRI